MSRKKMSETMDFNFLSFKRIFWTFSNQDSRSFFSLFLAQIARFQKLSGIF